MARTYCDAQTRLKICIRGSLLADASGSATTASIAPEKLKSVDAVIEEVIAARSLPGAALAVTVEGKMVASRVFVVSNVDTNVPVTRATLFHLAPFPSS